MKYTALKGVCDILPAESGVWKNIIDKAHDIFSRYGFREIIVPIIEESALFTRGIGQDTDIVQKEMYTFTDRGGRSIALRPEATASVVRAYLEHNLSGQNVDKVFYYGPMFRGEKPQAGRNRQFYQIGVEAFGSRGAKFDAEIISCGVHFLQSAGLRNFTLNLNSVGLSEEKSAYGAKLREFLSEKTETLCASCRSRYERNILRILDCKSEICQKTLQDAPKIIDSLSETSRTHFQALTLALEKSGVPFKVNPYLVRGLDYYTQTVFEITHDHLGAQNTILAGGRYNNLVRELGGPDTGAIGFALGVERLLLAINAEQAKAPDKKLPQVYFVWMGEPAYDLMLKIAQTLRRHEKNVTCLISHEERSLQAQMRSAGKGADLVLICGNDEYEKNLVSIKDFATGAQTQDKADLATEAVIAALKEKNYDV